MMNWNIEIFGEGNQPGKPTVPPDQPPTYADSLPDLPPLVGQPQCFRGAEDSPLLAPRAVWCVGEKLMVSDTGQNRVFIWNRLPQQEYTHPDLVLGQLLATDTGRNSGAEVSASTLHYPSGLWSDGKCLIVADAWNHRVLIWHTFPTYDGQPADVVLGQPDFVSNQPNVGGIGATPQANTLNWPYGLYSDGQQLWIADTGNRRVLYYRQIPQVSHAPADAVIGKPDFNTRDYENHEPIWPYSVRVSPKGALCIADVQYFRVLLWHRAEDAQHKPADVIIGQSDFEANGMNRFSLFPRADGLNWVYDACFYKDGLFVLDTGNSRLLWFEKLPTANGQPASNLIGHQNFETGSENAITRFGTELQLYWPFSACIAHNRLCVADTGNHRVLIYPLQTPPST